jgi:hypothetical protein
MKQFEQWLAGAVGVGILACVTNAAIVNAGGYVTTTAPMVIALACGLAIGSFIVGITWRHRRHVLAVLLVIALGAGEAYTLLVIAERTLANRESQQTPLRDAAQKLTNAKASVAKAEREFSAVGGSSRLQRALDAKARADSAAVEKAAEPSCATNCRALLEQQVATAAAELNAARGDVARERQAAEKRLSDAHAALAKIPLPPSPSPLADRLGVEDWKIDLVAAGLVSIATNGLAALLIAFAAHQGTSATPKKPANSSPLQMPSISTMPSRDKMAVAVTEEPPRNAADEAARFSRTMFRPARRGRVRVRDIRVAYKSWCADSLRRDPLPDVMIGQALLELFTRAGLRCDTSRGDADIVGMAWTRHQPASISTELRVRKPTGPDAVRCDHRIRMVRRYGG